MMSRLLPFIFVLIAGTIFMGYIHPTITGSIAETNTEIQSYDSALKAAARFEAKQAELAAARAALPPDGIARLEGFLPDGVDNVQLIFDLDALASRTGVKLSEFTTSESNKPASGFAVDQASESSAFESSSPYDSLDLSMSATGSYAGFRAFLAGAETSLRPLDLVELSLTDLSTDLSTGVYTYDMTFRLYWLR